MRKRTQGRESALKVMYQREMTGEEVESSLRSFFFSNLNIDKDQQEFIKKLVLGVEETVDVLDAKVEAVAENWTMSRMAILDRNIIRIAAFEMTTMTETPPKVVINEAVNIAKKYSGEKSGKFVNGLLDKLMRQLIDVNSAT